MAPSVVFPQKAWENERPALPFKDGWVSEAFECGSFWWYGWPSVEREVVCLSGVTPWQLNDERFRSQSSSTQPSFQMTICFRSSPILSHLFKVKEKSSYSTSLSEYHRLSRFAREMGGGGNRPPEFPSTHPTPWDTNQRHQNPCWGGNEVLQKLAKR